MRVAMLLSALVMSVVMPASAAARATNDHETFVDTFTDPDFCGTGVSIDGVFTITFTDHFGGDDIFGSTAIAENVLTNPANGASVSWFEAHLFTWDETGDSEGVHTIVTTWKGLALKIQTANGTVLVTEAGYITFLRTFDGDEFLSQTISVERGPHPIADSDFALVCEVTTAALGIS